MRVSNRFVAWWVLVFLLAAPTAVTVLAQNVNPGVLPPHSRPYGLTQGEWSARWWQWVFSIPASANPLIDSTGTNCANGQSGPVWFLAGSFSATQTSPGVFEAIETRSCTVPVGKALFFPIINAECSTAEGNGTTEAELRDCADFLMDHLADLTATIDGVAIRNLTAYRLQSPLFTFTLPQDNILALPPGTTPSVADGVHLMLAPLSAGAHTVHFSGALLFPEFDFTFRLDITYHLIVR